MFAILQSMQCTKLHWGTILLISGEIFCEQVNWAYESIVYWKHNLFLVPFGNVGSRLVSELAKLYESFGSASAMECIALKAAMVLPALLLQKPHTQSKSREHVKCLNATCLFGVRGNFETLLVEGQTIQQHPQHSHRAPTIDSSRIFAIKAAKRFLTEQSRAHFYLSPSKLESPQSSMNLSRNTPILLQLLL